MTEAEAEAKAKEKGVTLVRSDEGSTGYKGVTHHPTNSKSKPYHGANRGGWRATPLGCFSSMHEAALAYARHLGVEGSKTAAARRRRRRRRRR